MSNKEDKQQNITFDIDSDSEIEEDIGHGILSGIKKKIKNNTNIKKIKKETKITDPEPKIGKQKQPWKEFLKTRTEGKKFKSRQAVNDYMKEIQI